MGSKKGSSVAWLRERELESESKSERRMSLLLPLSDVENYIRSFQHWHLVPPPPLFPFTLVPLFRITAPLSFSEKGRER